MDGSGAKARSRVRIYLTHLLPALQKIHKGSSLLKRRRDIKFAADMCLAHTGNSHGRTWSRALNHRLLRKRSKQAALRHGRARCRRHLACNLVQRMRHFSLKIKRPEPSCGNTDQRFESGHGCNESMGTRLRTLQKLVPGGRHMEIDVLFQETADYILGLQTQVLAMQTLSDFYGKTAFMDSNKFDPLGNCCNSTALQVTSTEL
eukprot:Gb_34725 [translate_table: standard]